MNPRNGRPIDEIDFFGLETKPQAGTGTKANGSHAPGKARRAKNPYGSVRQPSDNVEPPGFSTSGTSGRVSSSNFREKKGKEGREGIARPKSRSTISPPDDGADTSPRNFFLPDLPDLPDAEKRCRTAAGHSPKSTPTPPSIGVVRLGAMTRPREQFEQLVNPDLHELLTRTDVPTDAVIEADKDAQLTVLDADTHHWLQRPDDCYLHAILAGIEPQADAAWVSHGKGLKLLFVGPQHDRRALAAALSIPSDFTVEVLNHTRHPRSVSSKLPAPPAATSPSTPMPPTSRCTSASPAH